MTDSEGGVIGLRREPSYSELDYRDQQRAVNAVDELCSEVLADKASPRVVVPSGLGDTMRRVLELRVVMPSGLDDTTRRVLELRRRDGYQVPEYFELNDVKSDRYFTEPEYRCVGVGNSDGKAPPRLWKTRDCIVYAAGIFLMVFTWCFVAVIFLVNARAEVADIISEAVGGQLFIASLLGALVLSAGAAAAFAAWLCLDNRAVRRAGAECYILSFEQLNAIGRQTVPVDPQWPEIRLAAVAERLADTIEASAAWADALLDEHRIVFSPEREAQQVWAHAMRIASMRARLGEAPAGDTIDHEQARAALRLEHELLDRIIESLHERVAALWSYTVNVEELSSQVAALRAIENSLALAPELDALARQTGADELSTRHLRAMSADAETISVKIAAITATLTNVLAPLSPNESHDDNG